MIANIAVWDVILIKLPSLHSTNLFFRDTPTYGGVYSISALDIQYTIARLFFCRPVRKNDIVMPDEARAIAREFGIHYYETSVLTYYGVNEVFENAIRAALISRRRQRFWMTNLKKVQRPLLQVCA